MPSRLARMYQFGMGGLPEDFLEGLFLRIHPCFISFDPLAAQRKNESALLVAIAPAVVPLQVAVPRVSNRARARVIASDSKEAKCRSSAASRNLVDS